jgi:glycosyltransferase involved in cell wall biosynthesis
MIILFIHQNFPAQFKHLAPALAACGHQVSALTLRAGLGASWQNVQIFHYQPTRSSTPNIHPWVIDLETKIIRAEAVYRYALQLKEHGYQPDLIIAHPGWGESLFVKEIWPQTKLAIYCEFYYHRQGGDVDFDPEFQQPDPTEVCRIKLKNLNNELHFALADAGIAPTNWQASTFPKPFRQQITVIHDGIDTQAIQPNPKISITLSNGKTLSKADEVITYVARNLEPQRGFHIFMRTLPTLLKQRPLATVLIIGGHDISYGAAPSDNRSWKAIFIEEVQAQMPAETWARIHFLGQVSAPKFMTLLQLSTVHIYLTYPFVLSWSLLEAMSAGCAIIASNTQPLHEAIIHQETGLLVDFFDIEGWVNTACALLDDPQQRQILGDNARRFVQTHFDLQSVCLPKQLAWLEGLNA